MTDIVIKEFQNSKIRFELRKGKVWGCLTDMAQASGKKVNDWYRLKTTTEYLEALALSMNTTVDQIVQVSKSVNFNENTGTWSIDQVVIDFARWCSIPFRIWTNEVVSEVLTKGGYISETASSEQLAGLRQRIDFIERERDALKSWSPNMPMHKIRFLEIINYKGEEYSPFLQRNGFKPIEFQREEEYEQYQKDIRDQKLVLDLIDTLFNGEKLQFTAYGYDEATWDKCFEKLKNNLPVKLYRVLINQYQDFRKHEHPKPAKQYEQFQFSVELKHERSKVWLEYVPEKQEMLKSYLFESDKQLVG